MISQQITKYLFTYIFYMILVSILIMISLENTGIGAIAMMLRPDCTTYRAVTTTLNGEDL
ncbi:MAG: hypothetical protein K0R54_5182 [Clostridiaceae bacterium]|nr:hypothetical protein [Clostridiaceae bacterium]